MRRTEAAITSRNASGPSGTEGDAALARLAATVKAETLKIASADERLPRDCGSFDIHIDRDGNWFYCGSPIKRAALVRLFSTVLQRDAEGGYWLITPAERGRITVDDVPFIGVELSRSGEGPQQALSLRTNVDETVAIDAEHRLRVATDPATGAPRPYVLVRNALEARLARPVFYELVDLGCEERVGDTTLYGVWSRGTFFPLGHIEAC